MTEPIDLTVEFGDVRDEEQLDWSKLAAYLRDKVCPAPTPR